MIITASGKKIEELQEELLPVKILDSQGVENVEGLMKQHFSNVPSGLSFVPSGWTCFQKVGSYVVLDYGRELCGGIRMIVRSAKTPTRWRVTFGESLSEACSSVGEQNATNDHSPRDFEIQTSNMSDLKFGQTGFRFVRLELLEDTAALLQSVFAISYLPIFHSEAKIVTNDNLLNDIIDTAAYTLKLNFQNGYIWDGIKRDRLVWCGDLHPEILTSLYLFGDSDNIKNSLTFLRETTDHTRWINNIPSYSAWWVINLCEHYCITGNQEFFNENREYALGILEHLDQCIKDDGEADFEVVNGFDYFLDWSTHSHEDAKVGVNALLCWMAQRFLDLEENENCRNILKKLSSCVDVSTTLKPVRAFQVLAGRNKPEEDEKMLAQNGAKGFSTFMAYYILRAMAASGGTDMLAILKEYYGGMLSRGATTFWEDFDIEWLEGSGRIDELPKEGQKDIHGDFGKYCYKQFRHSLCHGWSAGVLAFIIEYIVGLQLVDGGKAVSLNPHMLGLTDIEAQFPVAKGVIKVSIHDGKVSISVPDGMIIKDCTEKA